MTDPRLPVQPVEGTSICNESFPIILADGGVIGHHFSSTVKEVTVGKIGSDIRVTAQ
ncbi:hypothetical protein TIFTF001_031358 [Ficus carica]|uniref:Uncharacterized protein n=1 Tax=Ficus carica TaxID=3494 RepID=A0AA88J5D2_FICCA|nr:hypothetical protein TIFTF001_031358 [Ficus carica]